MKKLNVILAVAVLVGLLGVAVPASAGTATFNFTIQAIACEPPGAFVTGFYVDIEGWGGAVDFVDGLAAGAISPGVPQYPDADGVANGTITVLVTGAPEGTYNITAWLPGVRSRVTIPEVELVDTDGNGVVDAVDLFAKNNFNQISFSGIYCLPLIPYAAHIQVPVIFSTDGWETWICVQNVGSAATKATMELWAPSDGVDCQPQEPLKTEVSGNIQPGAHWCWKLTETYPAVGEQSAIITADQPIAVTVQRTVVDPAAAGGDHRSSIYKGIPAEAEYGPDPNTGAYMYYAPLIFSEWGGGLWDTTMWIQNSGDQCTSVEVWYVQDCQVVLVEQVQALYPGKSISVPGDLPPGIYSAWIRASQPLGIVVDQEDGAQTMLLSYTGFSVQYQDEVYPGALENFGPLIYRECYGWNSGIQVMNMDSTTNALVKVYFLDNSGDIIKTVVDWVCKRSSANFYLPAIAGISCNYVGQVRVHSQNWQTPGDPEVDAPKILSIANLINYDTGQALSYNLLPAWQAWYETPEYTGVAQIALPFLVKQKHDPFEPTDTTWTSKIALTNLVHFSSANDVVVSIDFFDQNGLLYRVCQKLNPKDVDYIDLDDYGIIPPGWLGSAVITVQCTPPVEPDDAMVGIGAVVVNMADGYASGDLTTGYEAFPILNPTWEPPGVPCVECTGLTPWPIP